MAIITVTTPNVGLEAYFSFKEPIATFLKNKFNFIETKIKLKVTSVISLKDLIKVDKRDPFTTIYSPAGISEPEYKQDLINNVPLIGFTFISKRNIEEKFRVPLSFISSIDSITNVRYINKCLILDFGMMEETFDMTVYFDDLKDFLRTRIGKSPEVKEVNIGATETITYEEHQIRENIRQNNIKIRKTLAIQLEECKNERDELIYRINQILNS